MKSLKDREDTLIAACDAVNADSALRELVDDWQAMDDPIEEPWHEPDSSDCAIANGYRR